MLENAPDVYVVTDCKSEASPRTQAPAPVDPVDEPPPLELEAPAVLVAAALPVDDPVVPTDVPPGLPVPVS